MRLARPLPSPVWFADFEPGLNSQATRCWRRESRANPSLKGENPLLARKIQGILFVGASDAGHYGILFPSIRARTRTRPSIRSVFRRRARRFQIRKTRTWPSVASWPDRASQNCCRQLHNKPTIVDVDKRACAMPAVFRHPHQGNFVDSFSMMWYDGIMK